MLATTKCRFEQTQENEGQIQILKCRKGIKDRFRPYLDSSVEEIFTQSANIVIDKNVYQKRMLKLYSTRSYLAKSPPATYSSTKRSYRR
jgi:hypothetical protein